MEYSNLLPQSEDSSPVDTEATFGFAPEFSVKKFNEKTPHVPPIDKDYRFDPETTNAILAGFSFNRRVMIQGYHGTGKSTHIEQVAARLNWPCIRINLDSHISRIDLIGKDAISSGKRQTGHYFQGRACYLGLCKDLLLWFSMSTTLVDLT